MGGGAAGVGDEVDVWDGRVALVRKHSCFAVGRAKEHQGLIRIVVLKIIQLLFFDPIQ